MRSRENHTVWCTYTFVSIGMLAAVQIVLSRFLAIPVGGFGRIALSPVATIMAGLWLGPVAGGLTGLIADLIGCLIQGFGINPIITLSAVMWGVIPGLLCPPSAWKKSKKIVTLILAVILTSAVCSLGLTTAGLVLVYGYNFYHIITTRLTQFAVTVPLYCLLIDLLYFSPVTSMVRTALRTRLQRREIKKQNS